jgi:predicted DsbA family dithiol-disulfide isomerase
MLNSEEGMEAIKEANELARRFRVDGVPYFIINNELTLGGAQQPDKLLEALGQAR